MAFHNLTHTSTPSQIQISTNPTVTPSVPDTSINSLIDYNDRFKTATPICFRDEVISQILSVLISMKKPNAMLIGPAGSGKTAIVEDIARRLATQDMSIPAQLKDAHVYELVLSNLVAGASVVGELEQKTRDIIDFASNPDNHAILFIDEIHLLLSDKQVYGKIANILKPALGRGNICVIGATTLQEASDITHDPAFARRFSRVIVDELSQEQTIEILKSYKTSILKHYQNKITLPDDVLCDAVNIADNTFGSTHKRPDSAITLLDRTISSAILDRQNRLNQATITNNQTALTALNTSPQIPITTQKLKRCANALVRGYATQDDFDPQLLQTALSEIKGQDEAIKTITNVLIDRDLDLIPDKTPTSILLCGPTGTGKSALAKIVAQNLNNTAPITLNMTEYNSPAAINRIIGAPAGYIGFDSHAELPFDILESNPYQVIILDEIEKCDRSVQRLFLSVFDEGYLTYANGKTIDFSKTIIFATTNAGAHKQTQASIGFADTKPASSRVSLSALSKYFDLEFLNRFTVMVNFNTITRDVYKQILTDKYARLRQLTLGDRRAANLPDTIPSNDLEDIIDNTYDERLGARSAKHAIKTYMKTQIIKNMLPKTVQGDE